MSSLGFQFPWTTFLFAPDDRFNDWHNSVAAAATGNPYYAEGRAISAYFPVAYKVLLVGAGLPKSASIAIYLGISLCLLVVAIVLARQFIRPPPLLGALHGSHDFWYLLLGCLLSYPFLFALDRGNLDVWIALLCIIYVACLRTRYYLLGTVALALAICLKAYPLAFLLLAISERQYRAVLLCALISIALTAGSLASMSGGFLENLIGLSASLARYYDVYVVGTHSLFASSDPYNGFRSLIVFYGVQRLDISAWSPMILRVYTVLSTGFAIICVFYVLAVPASRWRRIMAVCLLAILFPNVANDYKLTLLLPGLLTLLFDLDPKSRRTDISLTLLLLLMIPKSYFFFEDIGLTNLINPSLLIILAVIVLADRRAWRQGLRLCRFRIAWYFENVNPAFMPPSFVMSGKLAPFLKKNHWSMRFD